MEVDAARAPSSRTRTAEGHQPVALTAWERLAARFERRLWVVERAASAWLDRALETTEQTEAVEAAATVATWLGRLGFGPAADLARSMVSVLAAAPSDRGDAIALIDLVDELRLLLATAPTDIAFDGPTQATCLIVGQPSTLIDSVIWVAAATGLDPIHSPQGLDKLPGTGIDVVAVLGRQDGHRDEPGQGLDTAVARGLRQRYAAVPMVAVVEGPGVEYRTALSRVATTVLDHQATPQEVVDEILLQHALAGHEPTVAVHRGPPGASKALEARGLDVIRPQSDGELISALLDRRADAVMLPATIERVDRLALIGLIRSHPTLRSSVVVVGTDDNDPVAATRFYRAGADQVIEPEVGTDELAARLKASLGVRALSRPRTEGRLSSQIGGWGATRSLIDRLLVASQRQGQVSSLAVMARADDQGPDAAVVRESLGREFREGDVVAMNPSGQVVVILRGAPRRVGVGRLSDAVVRHGLGDTYRVGVAEFPYDGRSVDALVASCEEAMGRAAELGGPEVVPTDWRPVDERAADVAVIDGDETLAVAVEVALQRSGLRTTHFNDGVLALDYLVGSQRNPLPRLLLLEFDPPGIEGLQLLRRLNEGGVLNSLQVLMFSARTQEASLRQAFDLGAIDVLRKPFPATLLVQRITRTLRS